MKGLYSTLLIMTLIMVAGFSFISMGNKKGIMDEKSLKYKINQINNNIMGKITDALPSEIKNLK